MRDPLLSRKFVLSAQRHRSASKHKSRDRRKNSHHRRCMGRVQVESQRLRRLQAVQSGNPLPWSPRACCVWTLIHSSPAIISWCSTTTVRVSARVRGPVSRNLGRARHPSWLTALAIMSQNTSRLASASTSSKICADRPFSNKNSLNSSGSWHSSNRQSSSQRLMQNRFVNSRISNSSSNNLPLATLVISMWLQRALALLIALAPQISPLERRKLPPWSSSYPHSNHLSNRKYKMVAVNSNKW